MSEIQKYTLSIGKTVDGPCVVETTDNPNGKYMRSEDVEQRLHLCFGHIHFLLGTLALAGFHSEPTKGLDPTFYHIGSCEGDLNIWEMINSIKDFVKPQKETPKTGEESGVAK